MEWYPSIEGDDLSDADRRFPYLGPPRLFGIYAIPPYDLTTDVPGHEQAIGWGLEFDERAFTLLCDTDGSWSYAAHRSASDAVGLFAMVQPVRLRFLTR